MRDSDFDTHEKKNSSQKGYVAYSSPTNPSFLTYILRGVSPRANYTKRPPLVDEVSAYFCG
jgi:hypothetical protein